MTPSSRQQTPDAKAKRKQAEKAGRRAEWLCTVWLRLKGYRILECRHQSRLGEIDIIAKRGKMMAAIEVKNRARLDDALLAIRPQQQQRIARALHAYAAKTGHDGDLRLDLMAVGQFGRIWHFENAWQAKS